MGLQNQLPVDIIKHGSTQSAQRNDKRLPEPTGFRMFIVQYLDYSSQHEDLLEIKERVRNHVYS